MRIKKYKASTEKEAMLKVKEELGSEALIVSVRTVKPKFIFKWFKKQYVEITAATDDFNDKARGRLEDKEVDEFKEFLSAFSKKQEKKEGIIKNEANQESKSRLEKKTRNEKVTGKTANDIEDSSHIDFSDSSYKEMETPIVRVIYNQLVDNDVNEELANKLLEGLENIKDLNEMDAVIEVVYQRIINLLSDNDSINLDKEKVVFFIGPTGVGKTTTIAKIASLYSLKYKKKVALITADTYRIAAVEQLKTYADILNIPIRVVYQENEIEEFIEEFKEYDLILIDTAGRSHKDHSHKEELNKLLDKVEEKKVLLVLNIATKYNDIKKILVMYDDITEYSIVFTKLDETDAYGNIINIKDLSNKNLSYITFGQNVPDDISEMDPHLIAKNLLGGEH